MTVVGIRYNQVTISQDAQRQPVLPCLHREAHVNKMAGFGSKHVFVDQNNGSERYGEIKEGKAEERPTRRKRERADLKPLLLYSTMANKMRLQPSAKCINVTVSQFTLLHICS